MNPTGSSTLHHLVLAFTRVCSVLGAGLSTESRDVSPRGSGNVGAEEGPERGGLAWPHAIELRRFKSRFFIVTP